VERKTLHVAHLEGLAAVGKVSKFWVEECGSSRRKKVVAMLEDGEVVETRCIDYRGVKKVVLFLAEASRLSPLIVTKDVVDFDEVYEE
jgi:hypothetical protein